MGKYSRFIFYNSGFNLRSTDIAASIGLNQFKNLDEFIKQRSINRDKIIKKSDTYAKLLNNWDKLADNEIHKFCKPESITNIGDSSIKILNIKVTPGKEVDVEYARDDIIKNINIFI